MSVKRFASIWNAASSPTALPALVVATAGMTTLWPSPARALVSAPRATPQRYGDRGAPERPCAPPPAGAPVGAAQVPKRLRFLLQRDGAVPISGKYSCPLGQILSHRAYPRRVGHSCGMTVTRSWARVLAARQSQIYLASQDLTKERLRALKLPGSNMFRIPKPVPLWVSCS